MKITHFIPAEPGWRIAISRHSGEDNLDVQPIIGWIVHDALTCHPVFRSEDLGVLMTPSQFHMNDAYVMLAPNERVTDELRLMLLTARVEGLLPESPTPWHHNEPE